MMITNILDFMVDADGNFIKTDIHIPDHEFYSELSFPYSLDLDTGVFMDKEGYTAVFSLDLLNSLDWEILDD